MEKIIIEYLDLIKKLNSDFNPDYKFINSLLEFTDHINELKKEGFANIVISYSMQTGIVITGNGTHDDLKLQNKN